MKPMTLVTTCAALLLGLGAGTVFAQGYPGDPGAWHPAWGWGHMIFGALMMILFWGGLIVFAVFLFRWLTGNRSPDQTPHRPTARQILDERFARGEIEKDEYEDRRRLLGESNEK